MDAQGRSQDRPRPDDRLLSAAPCSLLECVHMILMNDFKAEPAEIRTAMTDAAARVFASGWYVRSEEHTSELQSLMRISYAVFCLKKKTNQYINTIHSTPKYITINHNC